MEKRDPWAFQRWAFEVRAGSTTRKAVLMMLAGMADTNTGRCEAKQETLAAGVETSDRTIRTALRELEKLGLIARRDQRRRDGSRRGDEFLLRAPWVSEWPDGERLPEAASTCPTGNEAQDQPENGDRSNRKQASAQERPPTGTTTENPPAARTRATLADTIPDDFPDELRPHARTVYRLLREWAEEENAREVKARALARTMMAYPRAPLVREALRCMAHFTGAKAGGDVVRTYGNWLGRAPTLATTERLTPDGMPYDGPTAVRGAGRDRNGQPSIAEIMSA